MAQAGPTVSQAHTQIIPITCTSWGSNSCMPVVFSIISTDQSNSQGTLNGQRQKQRTFDFLSPKHPESPLEKLRCESKGVFSQLYSPSSEVLIHKAPCVTG